MNNFNHRLDEEEHSSPIVELLPDGRILIHSIEMGEITVETNSHGKLRIIVEETAKENYGAALTEFKAKRNRQDLLDLMQGEANNYESDFSTGPTAWPMDFSTSSSSEEVKDLGAIFPEEEEAGGEDVHQHPENYFRETAVYSDTQILPDRRHHELHSEERYPPNYGSLKFNGKVGF